MFIYRDYYIERDGLGYKVHYTDLNHLLGDEKHFDTAEGAKRFIDEEEVIRRDLHRRMR